MKVFISTAGSGRYATSAHRESPPWRRRVGYDGRERAFTGGYSRQYYNGEWCQIGKRRQEKKSRYVECYCCRPEPQRLMLLEATASFYLLTGASLSREAR